VSLQSNLTDVKFFFSPLFFNTSVQPLMNAYNLTAAEVASLYNQSDTNSFGWQAMVN
jgi:hypothetical protein